MTKPRKKWKTVEHPVEAVQLHTSEAKAYEVVNTARAAFHATPPGTTTGVTVYEYDATCAWSGREPWALFDTHDFAKGE